MFTEFYLEARRKERNPMSSPLFPILQIGFIILQIQPVDNYFIGKAVKNYARQGRWQNSGRETTRFSPQSLSKRRRSSMGNKAGI